jgi:hypothetical protein
MKTIQLTVTQFSELYGTNAQSIRVQLNRGGSYPPILKVEKFGRAYMLTVLKSWVDAQNEYKNYMNGNSIANESK